MTSASSPSTETPPRLAKSIASFLFLFGLVISLVTVPLTLCYGCYILYGSYRSPAGSYSLQDQNTRLEQMSTDVENAQQRLSQKAARLDQAARTLLEGEDARATESSSPPPVKPQP